MAFCASCGAEGQGKFCAKCGASMDSAADGAPLPPPRSAPVGAQAAGLEENVAGALCYLVGVLTGILFLVIDPYNRNPSIRFHAFQSIFAWVAAMVIGMVLSMFSYPISAVPFIG